MAVGSRPEPWFDTAQTGAVPPPKLLWTEEAQPA